ncbi:MAG: hypothetical protein HYT48_02790 [Candidatus Vogelbacteria bacterium]|nr:hypothetical protein [Candidatus Vogelbacteria bacterium]
MSKQKGFAPIIAIILAVIIIAGGAYLYTKNQTVTPATNLEAKPPSGWKTQ